MAAPNTHWGDLYKIAGISALILLVYSLVTMALLAENRLISLLRLDVLTRKLI